MALGEEQLPVRRGPDRIDYVPADDLMLEGLIKRALIKTQYAAIVDLYARLDVEEETTLTRRRSRATAAQKAATRDGLAVISDLLSKRRDQLVKLGVAHLQNGELKIQPWIQHRLSTLG